MGYPMTWQRFISRNGLKDGGYEHLPQKLEAGLSLPEKIEDWPHTDAISIDDLKRSLAPSLLDTARRYQRAFRNLAGDLRRLESDTVDEKATCRYIADRTGVDADTVAIVLKEFMQW